MIYVVVTSIQNVESMMYLVLFYTVHDIYCSQYIVPRFIQNVESMMLLVSLYTVQCIQYCIELRGNDAISNSVYCLLGHP